MKKFTVDFLEQGQTVGWFTYDVYATDVFNAACELFACCGLVVITNIFEA